MECPAKIFMLRDGMPGNIFMLTDRMPRNDIHDHRLNAQE
jgi:hypothetical protein